MNKSCLPNPQGPLSKQHTSSCIESANNHVEEMAKQTTAKGAKDRKRGPYKSCLVSFSSYYLHCTSPTPSHVQLWAERQRELSARVLRRGGNHEKMWRSRKYYHENFQLLDFQQFHENFEPRKFGAIRYNISITSDMQGLFGASLSEHELECYNYKIKFKDIAR